MAWDTGLDNEFRTIAGYEGRYSSIIAGAGTGKSFALKRKVARLLEEGEQPASILAVTFTRTAAKDLKSDLLSLGVDGCELVRACTIHSLCYSILSSHEVFRVMERETRTLADYEVSYLIADLAHRMKRKKTPLKEQLHAFQAAWARLLSEEAGWPDTQEDRDSHIEMISWLRFHKAMLIGEVIPLTISYLRNNPTCPEKQQYKHIIIDEYQDLNKAEQTLINLLSEYEIPENRTLTIAGDDDQSIFVTLKYAHPEGILLFKENFPDAYECTLTTCRRCPTSIIDISNSFIVSTNRKENPKLLVPREDAQNGDVRIIQWRTPAQEARGVARIISRRISRGDVDPSEIIVLTPRKQVGYEIKSCLDDLNIDATTCFTDAVLNYSQAQESHSYLNLLKNRADFVSLRVLLGHDSTNKRVGAYERIRSHVDSTGNSLVTTLTKLHSGELVLSHANDIIHRYGEITSRLNYLSTLTLEDIIDELFPSGIDEVAEIRDIALLALEKATDINELWEIINNELTQPELPEAGDSVLILTLHKAKGLTRKMVVVVNCIEGCLPSSGYQQNPLMADIEMAEQERLFFVALTRATEFLIISSSSIMRRGDVARMNVRPGRGGYWNDTFTSRFLDMLGNDAPRAQIGNDYLRTL